MALKFYNIFYCKTLQKLYKIWIFGLKIYHLAPCDSKKIACFQDKLFLKSTSRYIVELYQLYLYLP
jgi:hypothetical protein